ncbi:MAG: N-acetylmuramoyl-L-alanine amidase [Alphaproteobacteria bacterium]|nr:N-acetylmuramoyl-L-alanine amidase [Alphaproteobacteria bacterium]
MTFAIEDAPSPNFDERGRSVDMIVLHYTGMPTGGEALARLRDPAARVSAHYLVEEDGRAFRLVPEEMRAWHAGVASWRGETDINARSVGIEIVNPGHEWGYRPFPERQVETVVALVAAIAARHCVCRARVVGHADVAPLRKEDPGELFPWDRLAAEGLAIGPYAGPPDPSVDYSDALKAIAAIGYDVPEKAHAAAVLAFQRRFCPAALGQGLSPLTKAAALWGAEATAG